MVNLNDIRNLNSIRKSILVIHFQNIYSLKMTFSHSPVKTAAMANVKPANPKKICNGMSCSRR